MDAIGRIGIVMPEIVDPLDYELLSGIHTQAAQLGYDVIVYTGIYNSQSEFQQDYYTDGLENIYSLICQSRLDGIIFAGERFRNPDVIDRIFQYLSQTRVPSLTLGMSREGFPHMIARQHDGVYRITKHLIEEHGCKRLYCIAGVPEHESSQERLQGFIDAVTDAGLPLDDNSIRYGWYWRDAPIAFAREIADGSVPRPDGVVALSDSMAIPFCRTLMQNGIRVPEDIALTGYDGSWFALMHHPQITTVSGRDQQLGADAVCRLHEILTGHSCRSGSNIQQIRIGRSCGCGYDRITDMNGIVPSLERLAVRHLTRNADRTFIATDTINRMADAASMEELFLEIDKVGHILRGWKWLDLCLCEDWKHDFDNPDQLRQHGFSDRMYLALSKRHGTNAENGIYFPCAEILPALSQPHAPCMLVLTSLHCKGQIFGYCATMYEDPEQIALDEQYVSWCEAVANGLHLLQKRLYTDHVHQQMEAFTTIDPATGLLNKRGFTEKLPDTLHQLRKQTLVYRVLLISWLTESANTAYDTAGILANGLKNMTDGRFHARLGETVFAVLLSAEREDALTAAAEHYIAALETEIRLFLPDSAHFPRLITELAALSGKNPAELERSMQQLLAGFEEKKSITASYYVTHKELLYRLRRDIMSQPQLDWSIPGISKKLGISKSHLQRLYRDLFSTSIKDDIISIRMNKAMQLLAHTDFKVQEIAEHCGYNNENHFMRQFKEKTGVTALQYRKAHPSGAE